MNTTHKWNSYNDYSYQYYAENANTYKAGAENKEEQEDVTEKAGEYQTNFLDLPKGFKIGG